MTARTDDVHPEWGPGLLSEIAAVEAAGCGEFERFWIALGRSAMGPGRAAKRGWLDDVHEVLLNGVTLERLWSDGLAWWQTRCSPHGSEGLFCHCVVR